MHIHLPPVGKRLGAGNQLQIRQTIQQLDRAVMAKLQPLGQFADGYRIAPGKSFDGQQCLVLLGRQVCPLGGIFTETKELSQRIAKRREVFVLRLGNLLARSHRD